MSLFGNKSGLTSNKVVRYFLDSSSEMFLVLGEELKIMDANKTFYDYTGYIKKDLINHRFSDFVSTEHKSKLSSLSSIAEEESVNFDINFLSKTKQVRILHLKFHSLHNKNLLVIGHDITDERTSSNKLIEQNVELEKERVKVNAMLENIGDGVVGIDNGGKVNFVNDQALKFFGYNEEELLGNFFVHTVALIDDRGNEIEIKHRPVHTALLSKQKVIENKYSYRIKNSQVVPVAITATPIVFHDVVIGGVIVFRDIRKEREIDRMKTEFISLASHQLRTPLSAMKWFSELLLDGDVGELPEEQRDIVNNIYQSNERMIQLVNTLLNISRIESGRIIIEPEPTDLVKLINEVVLEATPRLNQKKQKLVISTHQNLPLINIDPKLIRHVYLNLITNASKYSPDGGEIIIVLSKTGNEIVSQVSDHGFGIPKDQQEKVFTKFFRADNVAKKETDGTGLGLYLTKAIVDSSGGKIWFDSEEGKGSTFWFIIPLTGSVAKDGEVSLNS